MLLRRLAGVVALHSAVFVLLTLHHDTSIVAPRASSHEALLVATNESVRVRTQLAPPSANRSDGTPSTLAVTTTAIVVDENDADEPPNPVFSVDVVDAPPSKSSSLTFEKFDQTYFGYKPCVGGQESRFPCGDALAHSITNSSCGSAHAHLPRFVIVVNAFEAYDKVLPALASALAQRYCRFRVLFLDDGSRDHFELAHDVSLDDARSFDVQRARELEHRRATRTRWRVRSPSSPPSPPQIKSDVDDDEFITEQQAEQRRAEHRWLLDDERLERRQRAVRVVRVVVNDTTFCTLRDHTDERTAVERVCPLANRLCVVAHATRNDTTAPLFFLPAASGSERLSSPTDDSHGENARSPASLSADDVRTLPASYLLALSWARRFDVADKLTLFHWRQNRGPAAARHYLLSQLDDDEVALLLDGDDRLANDGALARLALEYATGAWLTYGGSMQLRENGEWCANDWTRPPPRQAVMLGFARLKHAWPASHPRSFVAWLYREVQEHDLLSSAARRCLLDSTCTRVDRAAQSSSASASPTSNSAKELTMQRWQEARRRLVSTFESLHLLDRTDERRAASSASWQQQRETYAHSVACCDTQTTISELLDSEFFGSSASAPLSMLNLPFANVAFQSDTNSSRARVVLDDVDDGALAERTTVLVLPDDWVFASASRGARYAVHRLSIAGTFAAHFRDRQWHRVRNDDARVPLVEQLASKPTYAMWLLSNMMRTSTDAAIMTPMLEMSMQTHPELRHPFSVPSKTLYDTMILDETTANEYTRDGRFSCTSLRRVVDSGDWLALSKPQRDSRVDVRVRNGVGAIVRSLFTVDRARALSSIALLYVYSFGLRQRRRALAKRQSQELARIFGQPSYLPLEWTCSSAPTPASASLDGVRDIVVEEFMRPVFGHDASPIEPSVSSDEGARPAQDQESRPPLSKKKRLHMLVAQQQHNTRALRGHHTPSNYTTRARRVRSDLLNVSLVSIGHFGAVDEMRSCAAANSANSTSMATFLWRALARHYAIVGAGLPVALDVWSSLVFSNATLALSARPSTAGERRVSSTVNLSAWRLLEMLAAHQRIAALIDGQKSDLKQRVAHARKKLLDRRDELLANATLVERFERRRLPHRPLLLARASSSRRSLPR